MARASDEIAIDVTRVIMNEESDSQILFFKEVDGDRLFPLVIGLFEASAITRMLEGTPTPRPLTHDAWLSTVLAMGGTVDEAAITGMKDHTYFAEIRIQAGTGTVRVDARPSDAIAIAIKANARFLVNRALWEEITTE